MTSLNLSYLSIIIPIGFFILPCWELIKDHEQKGLKKITKLGWVMLVFAIISATISVLTIYVNNKEQETVQTRNEKIRKNDKKELEGYVDEAFKKHSASFNPITKTIVHYIKSSDTITIRDTTKRVADPVMDIVLEDKNPRLKGGLDTLRFRIEFAVINSGIAYNIRDKITVFNVANGNFHYIGTNRRSVLETTKGYKENKVWIESAIIGVNRMNPTVDTTYFYFKAVYSNKAENGTDQTPLRKIYFIVSQPFIKSIKDLGEVKEIQSEDIYAYLKQQLISNNYW